jgi:hypothetical protein
MAVPPPVAEVIRQAIGEFLATTIARLRELESGKIKSGEQPPNGPWVDITKREIEELKQRIAKLKSLQAIVEAKPGPSSVARMKR